MKLYLTATLLLALSCTGCGGGFQLSLPRFGRGDAPATSAYGPAYNTGQQASFWQRSFGWLTPGRDSTPQPEVRPGTLSPDDPLSLRNSPSRIGPDIYVKAGQLYESNGNLDRAVAQYEMAMKIAPNDPVVLVPYARLLDRQGKFEEALAMYSKAAKEQPDNPSIHNDLGLCLARHGRFEQSAQELEHAIRLRPQETLYRNNIAKVLIELGHPQPALDHLLAVHPPAVAHYNVGFLLYEKQQPQLAAPHFMRALELDSSFVKAERMLQLIHPQQRPSVAAGPPPEQRSAAVPRMLPPVR